MHVEIQELSQALSLQSGEVQNHLRLKLPDGRSIQVPVDAETAEQITKAFVTSGGAAAQRALELAHSTTTNQHRQPEASNELAGNFSPLVIEEGNEVFGGNYAPEDTSSNEWVEREAPAAVMEVAPRRAALQVSADSMGNPVIQGRNVVDSKEFMGGIGADEEEDGVGSV